jgi:N-acetyl-anhydromuramyl-L-alanine amidase AmpD
VDGWLQIDGHPVPRFDTPNVGPRMAPDLIVAHDTAGRLDRGSSVAWLVKPEAKASAHFVIERDGGITQLAPCDRQTWHAGKSAWRGRRHCNGFAIGIEIVSPGKLAPAGASHARAYWGQTFNRAEFGIVEQTTEVHGRGLWMAYAPPQIEAFEQLVSALSAAYPAIGEVVGHWQICEPKGRKVDPSPLFPERLLGPIRRPHVVEPSPPGGVSLATVQQRLAALGYFPGAIDGAMGPRTETALFAFQRQNGLPGTGQLDAPTMARLMADGAKAMPVGPRAEVTADDLAGVSRTVDEGTASAKEGGTVAAIGGFTVVLTFAADLGKVLKQFVVDFGGEVVLVGLGCGLLAYGWRHRAAAWRIVGYRVEDARTGRHQGGVGAPAAGGGS